MPDKKSRSNGSAIGVGLALGAALGLLMDNLATGIAIGLALGVAYSGVSQWSQRQRARRDDSQKKD